MKSSFFISFYLIVGFSLACSGQPSEKDASWTPVESSEAGFKAMFPCDPKVSKKLFQETPKVAHLYSYECTFEGVKFSVSLPERLGDFDPRLSKERLDSTEGLLREGIGEKGRITANDSDSNGYLSRDFEVDSGNVYGRQFLIEHLRGQYGIQAFGKYEGAMNRERILALASRFIDSFKLSQ
ncbi:MAG: hypothetical protein AB7J13_05250 [Pyrinomonadaceae bacterium]